LKLVIFAPDLERNVEVDKIVNEMKQIADEKFIPYLFGIKRRKIGFVLLKKVPVSVVGIFDYQGIQDKVNELMKHVNNQKIQ
jgi:selenocysteine insertion sequence-binding protein 2